MNKSKLISVAVLCALALGACVDDKESASVTALREAKTSYLKAQADYQTAQAEVARINADVAKAKAEAEAAIAKLRAEAEVAKTEAETKEIQQRAEAAQKEFEAKLAVIEAEAKANAAQYAAAYQEYLNELAAAQREAVMNQQNDLVEVIGNYKEALSEIRSAENTISEQTLSIADLNRQKLEALAGNALASAKNEVLQKQAEISGYKIQLQQYQIWYEAAAAAKKTLVEKLRDGLAAKADAVKVAQDKYLVLDDQIDGLKEQNAALNKVINGYYGQDDHGNWIHFAGKLDTLGNAWEVLNQAEQNVHNRTIFYYDSIGNEGSYYLYQIQNIKYYAWEVEKLLTDMNRNLTDQKALLTETDTLDAATKTLEALFAKLEKAQKENEEAGKAYNNAVDAADAAQEAVDKASDALAEAQASGDQAKITAAATALGKAEEARDKANETRDKANEVVYGKWVSGVYVPGTSGNFDQAKRNYEQKRDLNQMLESSITYLTGNVEELESMIAEAKTAKGICFGDLLNRVETLADEQVANNEEIDQLRSERADLYALYKIAQGEYDADKDIVGIWDSAIEHDNENTDQLAVVEARINTLEGNIATAEAELEHLNNILADPEKIDQEYCKTLNTQIKQAEETLAEAQDKLATEKAKAAAYKATIDAWSTGEAE